MFVVIVKEALRTRDIEHELYIFSVTYMYVPFLIGFADILLDFYQSIGEPIVTGNSFDVVVGGANEGQSRLEGSLLQYSDTSSRFLKHVDQNKVFQV